MSTQLSTGMERYALSSSINMSTYGVYVYELTMPGRGSGRHSNWRSILHTSTLFLHGLYKPFMGMSQ